MTLSVPLDDLHLALTSSKHPVFVNLPQDYSIVAITLDLERQALTLTIHSGQFTVVEAGEPIPPFSASYNGLMFRKNRRSRSHTQSGF